MKQSNREIENLVDQCGITGSEDMSLTQKKFIVSTLVDEENEEFLIESIINSSKPSQLSALIAQLAVSDNDEELNNATESIRSCALEALDDYYDDKIDEIISDHMHKINEQRMEEAKLNYMECI